MKGRRKAAAIKEARGSDVPLDCFPSDLIRGSKGGGGAVFKSVTLVL
jgi:hypothetical protein